MIWQFILTTLSTLLFFGFVIIGIKKFGLLNCYSAYGAQWGDNALTKGGINLWTIITIVSASLIIPVLLEQSDGSLLQFAGFLAPMSLVLVGATPYYNNRKFDWWLHQIGAWFAVGLIITYTIAIPRLFWVMAIFADIAGILTLIFGKKYWMIWFELAVYAGIYAVMYAVIFR